MCIAIFDDRVLLMFVVTTTNVNEIIMSVIIIMKLNKTLNFVAGEQ